MSAVGILGGSFNPPHVGHLTCARMAAEQLALDRVLVMPLSEPSHRELESDPGPEARMELCRLATAGDDLLEASDLEVARGGVSYTVETLETLDDGKDELTLILGADAADRIDSWRRPERILEIARLAIAPRGGTPDAGEVAQGVAGRFPGARAVAFTMPRIDISSSMLRERVATGRTVRNLVPPAVEDAIDESGWYRSR